MAETRTVKIERLQIHKTTSDQDRFFIRPGTRSRPWVWFDAESLPPFDGKEGWFEIERIKGGWRVLRQVEKPARGR